MKKIAQGAEAVLFRDKDKIIKERPSKSYRLPQLDQFLRRFRTRREAKILSKLNKLNFPAPDLLEFSDQEMFIKMGFVPGKQLKKVLNTIYKQLAKEIGRKIAVLHQNNIIHGDLTTSNLIQHQETGEILFIDFGLSFFSDKPEDKAVDLFLLGRALESRHYSVYPEVFELIIQSYRQHYPEAVKIIERLNQVKKRGRNKK